jgi:small subunit ribosomal protein S16
MVVIRLTRVGKKNSPAYRVVVADKRRAVKRKFIEMIGHYNPILKPKEVVIDKERALFWLAKGAMPSDTVRNLMADLGIIKKSEKINKVYGKAKKKKEMKEGAKATKPKAPVQDGNTPEEPGEEATAKQDDTEAPKDAIETTGETGEAVPKEIEEAPIDSADDAKEEVPKDKEKEIEKQSNPTKN